ncbi:MAG: hypothetical protein K2K00_02595 [Muribaculaceae bacterium]|nr:hypothetical protein [Muribaculaceae bacterium]
MGRCRDIIGMLAKGTLDWVFPRTCRVCGQTLMADERLMCLGCMADLPRTGLHHIDFNTIHQRVGGSQLIDIAAGWFYYYSDSPYAALIREAKYNDRPSTGYTLGRLYGKELADEGFAGRFDVLLPVPLYRNKLLKRGYNQSEEIARGLAEELGCDVGDNLTALRGHSTQTRHSSFERYENVRGTYGVCHGDELAGLNVAIVDDIVTTGSTILDCVTALCSAAEPASVNVLTIGVTKMR